MLFVSFFIRISKVFGTCTSQKYKISKKNVCFEYVFEFGLLLTRHILHGDWITENARRVYKRQCRSLGVSDSIDVHIERSSDLPPAETRRDPAPSKALAETVRPAQSLQGDEDLAAFFEGKVVVCKQTMLDVSKGCLPPLFARVLVLFNTLLQRQEKLELVQSVEHSIA